MQILNYGRPWEAFPDELQLSRLELPSRHSLAKHRRRQTVHVELGGSQIAVVVSAPG
jgi:hypothetical protein